MSGSDICIHGQPVDAYCRACESERAAPTTMSAAQVRQWMGERSAFPDTIYIAREDLVAIMAAMLSTDDCLDWCQPEPDGNPIGELKARVGVAENLYDLAHPKNETQAAT